MMDEFRLYLEGKVGDVMSANPVLLHKGRPTSEGVLYDG